MSENRKTINQYLKFAGNMTISDLVMQIPNDFRGVVVISEGDLIITDEDVLNFGYQNIRFFNELSILQGDLRQKISDKLKDQKKDIALIIFGDFYCGNSVSIEDFGLSIKGKAEVFGNDIIAKSIDVTEDLYCSGNITANKGISAKGDLRADGFITSESRAITVRGDLESDCITAYSLTVRGDVFVGNGGIEVQEACLDVRGDVECSSDINSKRICVRGDLYCDCNSIISNGSIYVGGDVEAEEIIAGGDLIIRGQANVPGKIDLPLNDVEIGKIAGNIINVNCKNLEIG